MQYLDAISKTTEWSVHFQGKPFTVIHSNPSLCSHYYCWRSWSWTILWRPTRPSRTNIQKRCLFHHRGLEYKNRKSEIPGITRRFGLGVQREPRQRPAEFCQENALVIPNTLFQQHKRQLYTWMSPDGQYQIRLTTFLEVEDGEALYSQ